MSRIAEVEHSKFLSVEREPVSIDHGNANQKGIGQRLYFSEKRSSIFYVFENIGENNCIVFFLK